MFLRTAVLAFVLAAGAIPSARAEDAPYLRPEQVDLTRFIAPAPTLDSPVTKDDVRTLLQIQAVRTPEQVAAANADVDRVLSRFSDAAGTNLSRERAPRANALVDKAWKVANTIVQNAKKTWSRPRPYMSFMEVQLVVPKETTGSYPSGHATWGMLTAIILADMIPEKAQALYERGIDFGKARLVGGVHYPSDVEAGRLVGTSLAALMLQNSAFQADFAAATQEVRGLLGLGALPAAPQPAAAQ